MKRSPCVINKDKVKAVGEKLLRGEAIELQPVRLSKDDRMAELSKEAEEIMIKRKRLR